MKPILFNTAMVRAILDGRKTVTRRVVKNVPENAYPGRCVLGAGLFDPETGLRVVSPPYNRKDILYVRETWCSAYDGEAYFYFADKCTEREQAKLLDYDDVRWRPSIHMPKEAARIFLRVTDVRVERLQDITPEQIDAEGCKEYAYDAETCVLKPSSPAWFELLWDSTVKYKEIHLYGWDANPWVWVIEFERIDREEAHHG